MIEYNNNYFFNILCICFKKNIYFNDLLFYKK